MDRQICRALGIRSMLAAPVGVDGAIGLLEVFSAQPNAFSENDSALLQRFAEMVFAAVNRLPRVPMILPDPGRLLAWLPRRAAFCLLTFRKKSPKRKKRKTRRKRKKTPLTRTQTKLVAFTCRVPIFIC